MVCARLVLALVAAIIFPLYLAFYGLLHGMAVAGFRKESCDLQVRNRLRILDQSLDYFNVSPFDCQHRRGFTPAIVQIEVDVRMLEQEVYNMS